ncbi:hypothetical protein [Mesoplasma tabanidae]|uniref:Uncharacterized protein n=1 Tax=Mesoplasma tabanidae TaxID=219745 RepID=A0A2K8P737_9MOLU|nr:hypothetical protein [Mesoplasma tabanidae]ATZ21553.1 hypothetical protein MTABA_v1c03500 [Mesoplasma tabanidae]
MKKIKKFKEFKFINICLWLLIMIFIIVIGFIFKIINQSIYGTNEWKNIISSFDNLNNKVIDSWFNNSKITWSMFIGPIGSSSFIQFQLVYKVGDSYGFIIPIFWDLLINWLIIAGVLFCLIIIIIEIFKINKLEKFLDQKEKILLSNVDNKKIILLEEAEEYIQKMENKYKEYLSNELEILDNKNNSTLSIAERSKIDGSNKIQEKRYELQKYSNKLRSLAIENKLPIKFQEINLRNLTKKELIEYMKKTQLILKSKKENTINSK